MSSNERPVKRNGSLERLIEARANGETIRNAARLAGMSESTARRRLEQPEVIDRIEQLRNEAFAAVVDRLANASPLAVNILVQVAADETKPASTRVRAAEVILSKALAIRGATEFEQRVAEVEQAVAAIPTTVLRSVR